MEGLLYEVEAVRRFAELRLTGPLPDETTILNFRPLLERHELGEALFETIHGHLKAQGVCLRQGTIVDATLIAVPSSTRHRTRTRDPEMHPTRKGRQGYFGMKLHIGVDAHTGVVHSLHTTPTQMGVMTVAHPLRHGQETRVWGIPGTRAWATGRRTRPSGTRPRCRRKTRSSMSGDASAMPGSALPGAGPKHATAGSVAGVWPA